jgi:hypothetical protein
LPQGFFSLYLCDQQTPLFFERFEAAAAPSVTELEGCFATLSDRQDRPWSLQFLSSSDAARFAAAVCTARAVAGADCRAAWLGKTKEAKWSEEAAELEVYVWTIASLSADSLPKDPSAAAMGQSVRVPQPSAKKLVGAMLAGAAQGVGAARALVALRPRDAHGLQLGAHAIPPDAAAVLLLVETRQASPLPTAAAPAPTTTGTTGLAAGPTSLRTLGSQPQVASAEGDAPRPNRALHEQVVALAPTQLKLVKRILSQVFTEVVAAMEEHMQSAARERLTDALESSLRAAAQRFAQTNEERADVTGTFAAIRASAEAQALEDFPASSQLSALRQQLAEGARRIEELERRQLDLASKCLALEEQLESAEKARRDLKKRLEVAAVFEGAVNDLRKLLDAEIESRQRAEAELVDLSRLQRAYKLSFVPKSSAKACLACRTRFAAFGESSAHYCRSCGRLFCKRCSSSQLALPELGFREPVRVCNGCLEQRGGA